MKTLNFDSVIQSSLVLIGLVSVTYAVHLIFEIARVIR